MARRVGLSVRFAVGALLAAPLGLGHPARAAQSCVGNLSANLVNPLPTGASINVHITDTSSENLTLGDRFKAGLTGTGVSLSDSGILLMELATTVVGLPNDGVGAGAVSPEFGVVGRLPPGAASPVLTMSISLMNTKTAEIDWVGYINCTIRNPDLGQVAYDIGVSVGHAIGQTFPPKRM